MPKYPRKQDVTAAGCRIKPGMTTNRTRLTLCKVLGREGGDASPRHQFFVTGCCRLLWSAAWNGWVRCAGLWALHVAAPAKRYKLLCGRVPAALWQTQMHGTIIAGGIGIGMWCGRSGAYRASVPCQDPTQTNNIIKTRPALIPRFFQARPRKELERPLTIVPR